MQSRSQHRPATRVLAIVLLIVGAGLIVLSLIADMIGIGYGVGFGYQQMIVLIVGIVLVLGAIRMFLQPYLTRVNRSADIAETERHFSTDESDSLSDRSHA